MEDAMSATPAPNPGAASTRSLSNSIVLAPSYIPNVFAASVLSFPHSYSPVLFHGKDFKRKKEEKKGGGGDNRTNCCKY